MVCYITCALAIALISASLYIMITKNDIKGSELLLEAQLGDVYTKIVKERVKIYLIATMVGAIFGILYLIWMRSKMSTFPLICTAVLIFFIVQFMIYILYPKSDYILNHITNQKESKAWLNMYSQMMKKFWIGFLIGLVGYIVLCLAILR
jgi:hypothetical protein